MKKLNSTTLESIVISFITLLIITIAILLTDISDSYSGAMKHLRENGTVFTLTDVISVDEDNYTINHLVYVDNDDVTTTMERKCLDRLDYKFVVRVAPNIATAKMMLRR